MKKRIGFIGGGNIAEAIIKGLVQRERGNFEIRVTNRTNKDRLKYLEDEYFVIPSDLTGLISQSEVIILAVKPKDIVNMAKVISGFNIKNKLIVSVAVGVRLAAIERELPDNAIIRAMPNTSSAVLYGLTGLVQGASVTEMHKKAAEEIFEAVGKVLWIPEDRLNAVMAMSGSAPAYVYMFTEALSQAGVALGLTEEESEMLAQQVLIGAGQMVEQSGKTPGRLREEVTSPNGTTFEAIKVFKDLNLEQIVTSAAKACYARAEEMEGEYSG